LLILYIISVNKYTFFYYVKTWYSICCNCTTNTITDYKNHRLKTKLQFYQIRWKSYLVTKWILPLKVLWLICQCVMQGADCLFRKAGQHFLKD